MKTTLIHLAELVRVFLTPTAVADSFAGFVLALLAFGVDDAPLWRLPAVTACSVFVYWFGMAANDIFDLEKDRQANPGRPLPSGRLSTRTAINFCGLLIVGAVSLGILLGIKVAVFALLACVLLYDAGGKRIPFIGNILMGICRFGNFILGGVAAVGLDSLFEPEALPLVFGGAVLGVYIAGVTAVSLLEEKEFQLGSFFAAAGGLFGIPLGFLFGKPTDLLNCINALLLGLLLADAMRGASRLNSPKIHGAAVFVRKALGGIFLVDAGCLTALAPPGETPSRGVATLYALFVVAWLWKRRWIRRGSTGS